MRRSRKRSTSNASAYFLVDLLRRVGLCHSKFADAAIATIRLKLLKLGAVRISVRRIHLAIASGCPNKDEFELTNIYLQRAFSSAEPQDAPKTPGLLIAMLTRALINSHDPLAFGRGRDAGRPHAPRTDPYVHLTAYGSYLGCLTANRWFGQG
jgi:hypothetical protein